MYIFMQVKKKGVIREAVSALRQRAGMKTRVRPTSLFIRERKGEGLEAMELQRVVHHRLQTDVAERTVSVDECEDTAGNLKLGGAWKQGAIMSGCGDVTSCSCVKRVLAPKTSDYKVARPKDLTIATDTSHTSYCPISLCEVEQKTTFPIAEIKRTRSRPLPLCIPAEINADFNHTPTGSSCSLEAAIDIPGYIPTTTVHASSDSS